MVNPIVLHNWTKMSKSGQTLVNWQKKSHNMRRFWTSWQKTTKHYKKYIQSSPCLNHTIMVIIIIVINMKQIYRALWALWAHHGEPIHWVGVNLSLSAIYIHAQLQLKNIGVKMHKNKLSSRHCHHHHQQHHQRLYCPVPIVTTHFAFLVAKKVFFSTRIVFAERSSPNTWHALPLKLALCHIMH